MLKVTEANIPIDSDLTAFPFESRELYPFANHYCAFVRCWQTLGYDYFSAC